MQLLRGVLWPLLVEALVGGASRLGAASSARESRHDEALGSYSFGMCSDPEGQGGCGTKQALEAWSLLSHRFPLESTDWLVFPSRRAAHVEANTRARVRIREAAENGSVTDMVRLGVALIEGTHTFEVDSHGGRAYLYRAAEQGSSSAMIRLAVGLVTGVGFVRDCQAGWMWLGRARDAGHPLAQLYFKRRRLILRRIPLPIVRLAGESALVAYLTAGWGGWSWDFYYGWPLLGRFLRPVPSGEWLFIEEREPCLREYRLCP